MNPLQQHFRLSRREFLTSAAGGIGGLALASLLAKDAHAAATSTAGGKDLNPLAPHAPHFAPRATNCIFFFLSGGSSQVDLFDPKPKLNELAGQPLPESVLKNVRFAFIQKDSARLMASPRSFKQHGQCGMEFSDLLPHIAPLADDICMIRSMHTEPFNHHPATIMMNSGFQRMGRPTIGSWLTYGLGSACADLPGYVVLEPGPGIRGGATNWSCGFMPSTYAGVHFNTKGEPVKNLSNPEGISTEVQRMSLDTIAKLNGRRFQHIQDPEIESRVASYELAFRMQKAAPELLDLAGEKAETLESYGVDRKDDLQNRFSTSALLARRMIERGVRFVNVYMDGWDHHGGLNDGLVKNCGVVDQPIAALIKDLKQRGLLDTTLVVWGTEFGRTPLGDNRIGATAVTGRDHQPSAFTLWMAGGGVKGGLVYGATDELGMNVVQDPVHINDFHATLLHLFGLNHEALTYRFEGRDYRLTDIAGKVVKAWLA
ncbi:MAG: DUF1501 domain-containing protein [Verrucomicrobia bacterium]|nr:DUF1501 domain-containing protein [Verrucomicrobiota bacterium]